MQNQDFEAYAHLKKFNYSISPGWESAAREAISKLELIPASMCVLDFGCGDGKYFPFFTSVGLQADNVHGVDVSHARIDRCHSIGFSAARYLSPGASLPYPDDMFDLVNFMEVIEHIPADKGIDVLQELRRVLKPGGVLLISTPNYPAKRFYDVYDAVVHRKWRRLRDDPTHVTKFSYVSLLGLLQQCGFRSVEPRSFKPGFLYKRFPRKSFLHKLFFICRG